MTSDPKAPGAAAVYLYVEEKTEDTIHFHSYYARIKVLAEKGRELATVHVPYERGPFRVAAIEGRTIHSDGSVIPLKAKPADLLNYRGGGHQYNDMSFTLPDVQVGSILEYRLQLRYGEETVSPPRWQIQQPYFVHRAHYFFNPAFNDGSQVVDKHNQIAERVMYSSRLRSAAQVQEDTKRRYTLDVADVQPLPDGDYLPPLNNIRENVFFYYTNAQTGPGFWDSEGKYWAKDAEKFTSASGPIKSAANGLAARGDSELARAQKVYAAVMKVENTDFMPSSAPLSKRQNKDAGGVWKAQRGTGDEIALLYVALARAAGLKAWPMQVVNRDGALFEPTYLSTDQLDDYIAVVQIDGNDVYLDPGQKGCPFGVLHWKHQLAKGFRMSDKGVNIEETPAEKPDAISVERSADIRVSADGNAEGTGTITMRRNEALYWRQVALLDGEAGLKKEFVEDLESHLPAGVSVDVERFDGLDDCTADLAAKIKIAGTVGAATGKRVIVPAYLFEWRGKHPFVEQKTRAVPVDLHYATMENDQVVYHLPAGMKADTLPRTDDMMWTNYLDLAVKSSVEGDAVRVERKFVRNAPTYDAALYSTVRYMYSRFAHADQDQIVLTKD